MIAVRKLPLDDESYAKLASRYADKGRLGMFMLAAFADADKIKMVKDNGLDFIRVGTAAGDGAKAVEAVKMGQSGRPDLPLLHDEGLYLPPRTAGG